MKRLLAGMAVALAAGPLAGQEAEPPVFPAGTEAVLLDMVVRAEDDRLVPDLRADEIQVFENGQLCAITSFRLVRAEDAGRPAPDLAGPSTPSTSLGPSPGTPGGARQGIVSPAEGARSTSVEDESLREPSHGGHERMGSVVLLVFDRLGLDGPGRPQRPDGGTPARAGDSLSAPGRLAVPAHRAGAQDDALLQRGLAVPPDLFEVFQSAIGDANRSNLTVYGFDARGLTVHGYDAAVGSVSRDPATSFASPWNLAGGALGAGQALASLLGNAQFNLRNLCEGTGGFLVANTNDLRSGLERIAGDLRAYYEIAYHTPNAAADGTWREIQVKVERPGVEVRARKGYFALPPGAPVVRPSELPLMAALEEKAPPRDVPLRAAAVHLAGAGAERDVLVALKVPLSAATFETHEGDAGEARERARLSLLATVRDAEGRLVARMSHDTPLEGSELEVEAIRAQSLVVKRALRLAPGRYTLQAAVLDRGSSEAGASRVAFEVPASTGLALGSLTVVRPEPLPEGSDDLLRAGNVRGTPRLGDPIVAAEGEVVGVFLSLQPGESPQSPEVALEIRRDGQIVSRSEAKLPPPDASGRVAYLGQFPAQVFEPGRYVLHARARQGAEEATAATSFRVVAPEPGPRAAVSGPALASDVPGVGRVAPRPRDPSRRGPPPRSGRPLRRRFPGQVPQHRC